MSLEVLLIPIGLALFAAYKESRSTDLCEKCKPTRIRDQNLLVESLSALGMTSIGQSDGRVTAQYGMDRVTFQRVGDIFLGRVDGKNTDKTTEMLTQLDSAVGRITQTHTIERLRERATEMGMILISEQADDGTIQLVFEEAR